MSTHKWIDRICVAVILLSLAVTVLFMNGEKLGIAVVVDEDAEIYKDSVWFTRNDLNADWDTTGATVITLTGDSAQISGNGAYWLNGSLTIVQSGRYVISGELTDGRLVVDADAYSKVWILLSGVKITCTDDACLLISQADKVFLTLAEGTENTLNGAETYSEEALESGTNAVIFARDDLTINGSGSLTVSAACLNGLTAKDDLAITGGTLSITAPEQGIKVNDRFCFTSADLAITAGQDGIHSDSEILMESGSMVISAEDDGLHADSLVQINGGSLQILTCYEGIEAVVIEQYGGEVTIHAQDDGINANGYTGMSFGGMGESADPSQTPVTADETYVLIAGGTLTITNTNGVDADGIDSNGNIIITGGTVRISMTDNNGNCALDCGTESGGRALISGGTVIACGNYSMAESFDSASEQCSILYNISDGISAGTVICLENASGSVLLTEEVPYGFSSVILSCPEITVGESYRLVIGDSEEEIAVTEVSASYGDTASQMFMGTMNWGGMQPIQMAAEGTPPPRPDGEEGTFPDGEMNGTPPALPDGETNGTRPAFPDGEMNGTPPAFPGGEMNGTPPSSSEGETEGAMPAFPAGSGSEMMPAPPEGMEPSESFSPLAEETFSGATETDLSPDAGETAMHASHFPGEGPGQQDGFGRAPQQETQTRTDSTGTDPTAETGADEWILVSVSLLCLIAGILIALFFKRSQHIDA